MVFLLFFGLSLETRVWSDETIRIEITEVPYRPPYAFLRVHFEFGGRQTVENEAGSVRQSEALLGFGLGLISAKPTDFQFEINMGYQRIKAEALGFAGLENIGAFGMHLGGRFFPRFPTFGLGKIPVRLTFSALGGVDWMSLGDWTDQFLLGITLTVGLVISSSDNPSGLLFEFVYRPVSNSVKLEDFNGLVAGTISLKPSWCFRIAWLFGPGS